MVRSQSEMESLCRRCFEYGCLQWRFFSSASELGEPDVDPTICPSPDQCPYYHYTKDADDDAADETPIHLLIASYRDKLCARTLHNAFRRAKNPKRLTFRVIEQTKTNSDLEDDEGCWDRYCNKYNPDCQDYKDQVRIVPVDSTLSLGPTWARSKLSAMVSAERMPSLVDSVVKAVSKHLDGFDGS